ncbi:MAG: 3-isopropylmalate dehydratase small subunit [Candidatus Omnitrophota bacterium]
MKYKGRAHKYGNNVNTDDIIPAKYLHTTDKAELASHCMEHIDPHFVKKVKKGDIIVAGENFGCGSSREHAPIAIKAAGIACVIADNFARIFHRNSINIGLPIVVSAEAVRDIKDKDMIAVDLKKGIITNLTRKKVHKSDAYPAFLEKIIKAEGLMNLVTKRGKK